MALFDSPCRPDGLENSSKALQKEEKLILNGERQENPPSVGVLGLYRSDDRGINYLSFIKSRSDESFMLKTSAQSHAVVCA